MLNALTMSNGHSIPAQGFGVFQIPAEQTATAVAQAIEAGYRHIDTAQSYANEEAVGQGIRKSTISRDQLFITTKIWIDSYGEKAAYSSIKTSLDKLGLDYLDLMLLHQPFHLRECGMGIEQMRQYMQLCLLGEESIAQREVMLQKQNKISSLLVVWCL